MSVKDLTDANQVEEMLGYIAELLEKANAKLEPADPNTIRKIDYWDGVTPNLQQRAIHIRLRVNKLIFCNTDGGPTPIIANLMVGGFAYPFALAPGISQFDWPVVVERGVDFYIDNADVWAYALADIE
jgi:hypothetical protein